MTKDAVVVDERFSRSAVGMVNVHLDRWKNTIVL